MSKDGAKGSQSRRKESKHEPSLNESVNLTVLLHKRLYCTEESMRERMAELVSEHSALVSEFKSEPNPEKRTPLSKQMSMMRADYDLLASKVEIIRLKRRSEELERLVERSTSQLGKAIDMLESLLDEKKQSELDMNYASTANYTPIASVFQHTPLNDENDSFFSDFPDERDPLNLRGLFEAPKKRKRP